MEPHRVVTAQFGRQGGGLQAKIRGESGQEAHEEIEEEEGDPARMMRCAKLGAVPLLGYTCKFCGQEGDVAESHWHTYCPKKDSNTTQAFAEFATPTMQAVQESWKGLGPGPEIYGRYTGPKNKKIHLTNNSRHLPKNSDISVCAGE